MVYPTWDTFKVLFTTLTSVGNKMTKIIFIKYIVLSILVVLIFLFIRTRLYCKNRLKIRRFKIKAFKYNNGKNGDYRGDKVYN